MNPFAPSAICLFGALAFPAFANSGPSSPAPDLAIEKLVTEYVLAATATDDERVAVRKPLLEFKFRMTNSKGGYLVFSEKGWEKWERQRDGKKPVEKIELVGRPMVVEGTEADEHLVYCTARIPNANTQLVGETLIFRCFRVASDEEGSWRIREERTLTRRTGRGSRWEQFEKLPTESEEITLRSKPDLKTGVVISTITRETPASIWVEEDEDWLVIEDDQGAVGFVKREAFVLKTEEEKQEDEELRGRLLYAQPVPGRKGYVFNPHTNGIVNVKGVPGGMLVRDPNDPNPSHVFRVPFTEAPARAMVVEEESVATNP